MAVQITKADLAAKVEAGWKKKALANHYGLPVMQMTKVLQQAGLTIRKFHEPKFVLIDEVAEVAQEAADANETIEAFTEVTLDSSVDRLEIDPLSLGQIETVSETIEPAQTVQAGW